VHDWSVCLGRRTKHHSVLHTLTQKSSLLYWCTIRTFVLEEGPSITVSYIHWPQKVVCCIGARSERLSKCIINCRSSFVLRFFRFRNVSESCRGRHYFDTLRFLLPSFGSDSCVGVSAISTLAQTLNSSLPPLVR
jgi:hypothetical protein